MAALRRARRLDHLLYLGHHRQSQGRRLFASRRGAADDAGGVLRFPPGTPAWQPRSDDADGADVPRQCLEHALSLLLHRRETGAARAQLRTRQALRALREREGDAHRGRADLLAHPHGLDGAQRQEILDLARHPVERLGAAARARRQARARLWRGDHAGLGHDRGADGDELLLEARPWRPPLRAAARLPHEIGPRHLRRQDAHRRRCRGRKTECAD